MSSFIVNSTHIAEITKHFVSLPYVSKTFYNTHKKQEIKIKEEELKLKIADQKLREQAEQRLQNQDQRKENEEKSRVSNIKKNTELAFEDKAWIFIANFTVIGSIIGLFMFIKYRTEG